MKRYRVFQISFDSRATILNTKIEDDWEEHVKDLWTNNKNEITNSLKNEYGSFLFEQKMIDFLEFNALPFSVIAYHNKFFKQIRDSFVIGAYYPALTATCTLGERILNHLILDLREDYKNTAQYKEVYSKKSFDNWDKVISILDEWKVLLPDVVNKFNELKSLRNFSIHFNPDTDILERNLALQSISLLREIIIGQFGWGNQPWFIPNIPGAIYLKKEAEEWPFVKKFIIPNCMYVGYKHRFENNGSGWFNVIDNNDYEDKEITDDEFRELLVSQGRGHSA